MPHNTVPQQPRLSSALSLALRVVLLCLLCVSPLCHATEQLTFVVGKKDGVYKHIIALVTEKLQQTDKHYDISTLSAAEYLQATELHDRSNNASNHTSNKAASGDRYIITIGTQAAEAVYSQLPDSPVISALITQSAYAVLQPSEAPQADLIPLFLDQPYGRFLALGKALSPRAESVGILLGPTASDNQQEIATIARRYGLKAVFALITPSENPINIIEPVMAQTDFFVVIPDQQAINQSAAKWVIRLGYRHKKPIIAYSKKYANAGALASVYVAPEDIAEALVSQLLHASAEKQRPYFSIYINPSVARSLRVPLPDDEQLKKDISSTPNDSVGLLP